MPFPSRTNPDAVLDQAIALIEESGWDALSMRELAARLGVRASSLYHHFKDRKAIEAALGERAASGLLDAMRRAKTLESMARAYCTFARNNRALYHLIANAPSTADEAPAGRELWQLLLATISPLTGNKDDTAAAVALWAYLHGYMALEFSGKFGASGPKGGFERGLSALLTGLAGKKSYTLKR